MTLDWVYSQENVDWEKLSGLYIDAGMGIKAPADINTAFTNSMFKCFIHDSGRMIGVGRALADGFDASYICDIAVHPEYQGQGIGKAIVLKLVEMSKHHRKIILYAAPGKDGFYKKLGFKRMTTAMAVFKNQEQALMDGLVTEG
ncbi:MAG TPA: N-acetyltransferase [Anaerolineae bacterium]|nr:N-acetyltransferase [Anaerolineae bacterium]